MYCDLPLTTSAEAPFDQVAERSQIRIKIQIQIQIHSLKQRKRGIQPLARRLWIEQGSELRGEEGEARGDQLGKRFMAGLHLINLIDFEEGEARAHQLGEEVMACLHLNLIQI